MNLMGSKIDRLVRRFSVVFIALLEPPVGEILKLMQNLFSSFLHLGV
jgi:hypothetical protein